jgi:uncharacterized protein YbbC (DUF1343 family)
MLDAPSPQVITGLEQLLGARACSRGAARCGLLMNQASVDRHWRYASHRLAEQGTPYRLVKLYSPQHGLWGVQQANMRETPHGLDPVLQIPIYSLYRETRRPTAEMLQDIDVLLVDLQDVGTRVYTYIWTLVHCLQACAEAHVAVQVLDRPNPLGGCIVEGPCLEPSCSSFVGMLPIPMRHGLTIGELALASNDWLNIGADLEVIPMQGWRRQMLFPDTGLPWVAPSPNMPRFETAVVYPGQVLLEGTNLSEGRGTTQPFELVGAPFIDPARLRDAWTEASECGIVAREVFFMPQFDKWQSEVCGGLAWHWPRAAEVRSYAATVTLLAAVQALWPGDFAWTEPPYEYEFKKPPIDILSGSDRMRRHLATVRSEGREDPHELLALDEEAWWHRVQPYLLYA